METPAGEDDGALVAAAREAARRAWAPYSGISVGAALRTAAGAVVAGCNVENASFGLTICAERTAAAAAVAAGHRAFRAIAIVSDRDPPLMPCGACRQFLHEFAPDLRVLIAGRGAGVTETTLARLLPEAFGPASLE